MAGDHLALVVAVDRFDRVHDLVAHDDVVREPHGRADDQSETDLSDDLETPLEPLLVVPEDLDVVVQPADEPEPQGRADHQLDVNVVEPPEQKDRHEYGHEDDDAAHRRRAPFLELPFESEVADLLADLLAAQEVDDAAAENDDDEQREDHGRRRTERNVLEHARARNVVETVEVLEQMVEHFLLSAV